MYPKYEDVLDVKLVSYTKMDESVADEVFSSQSGNVNLQEIIAYCARVSNPSNQGNLETSEKLIRYLVQHKHWSPFETVNVCLEVTSTRDIVRQILRHRSLAFQERSLRYLDPLTTEHTFCIRECRMQDRKNRQNSIECADGSLAKDWENIQNSLIDQAKRNYEWAISNGIAKEVARAVLPEGNTISRVYINGTIRSWIHFLDVRTGPETQKEHRLVAQGCAKAIASVFPMVKEFCK
jgi:thymidylate synthase (FAD)